jgi:protein-S-isoprenylcysteine O-methyltransferase Ste14
MRTFRAALGSAVFFVIAPGIVAGVVPWYLSDGWTRHDVTARPFLLAIGTAIVVSGAAALIYTFMLYVIDGIGTPAPVAPTNALVVRGLNRYVRNPMYMAVVAIIIGQALMLVQPVLFAYAAFAFALMAAFARWYEEPVLRERYGVQYDAYCERVPAWIPRPALAERGVSAVYGAAPGHPRRSRCASRKARSVGLALSAIAR